MTSLRTFPENQLLCVKEGIMNGKVIKNIIALAIVLTFVSGAVHVTMAAFILSMLYKSIFREAFNNGWV